MTFVGLSSGAPALRRWVSIKQRYVNSVFAPFRFWGALSKDPGAEVMDEQITAEGQRETRLSRLAAEDIRVEQPQVGQVIELAMLLYLLEDLAFQKKAEAAEPVDLDRFAALLFPVGAAKLVYGFDIDQKT